MNRDKMSSLEEFADLIFPLEDIIQATNNFADENIIGQGGFGTVYKGHLLLSQKLTNIAARRLHYDYGQGDFEFWNEISMLATLKHDNLVSFIGFCDEEWEKIIIYKHEVNGSLSTYLSSPDVTWMQRLQICVGVACALAYIHYDDGRESSVIHRNIKSSKILLDENWKPKLSGFELSKANTKARRHRVVLDEIVGTIGYVDPTYEKTGFVTHKSDIYSFGVVLFEVMCGRKAFVPDEREQHSPQYYTEQDYKDGKLNAMGKPDETADPYLDTERRLKKSLPSFQKEFDSQEPPILGSSTNLRPGHSSFSSERVTSFVNGQPTSFSGYDRRCSSYGGNAHNKPVSFQRPITQRLPSFVIQARNALLNELLDFIEQTSETSPPLSRDLKQTYKPTPPANVSTQSPANVLGLPRTFNHSKKQRFKLEPLYTMKRLDQYVHSPSEELLAQVAKSCYEGKNLHDIIHPALWRQMDPKSFEIFAETAFKCLDDKRAQRPNIYQILKKLEKALEIQEKSIASSEVEGTISNRWKGGPLERLQIPFEDIRKATNNFSKRFYLGQGGYGKVYHAELELPIDQEKATGEMYRKLTAVAVKRITNPQHGRKGFIAEIELLSRCKHTNIISLLGFCDEGPNMILVYEFASNGSLDDLLQSTDSSTNLTWVRRIKIGIDIARGLDSLHTRNDTILHIDIKSGNILLSNNMVAKIADFGLSRSNQQAKSFLTKNIAGTNVYLCPEYSKSGRVTTAIDIYSLGVVLFEILCGKLAYDQIYVSEDARGIAQVARVRFKDKKIYEMVDPKVMEEVDELTSTLHKGPNQDSLRTYIDIAYRCIAEAQNDRPTAKHILDELEKALSYQEKNKDNLQMSFEDIKVATKNFSRENLIGLGGFGNVYEGILTRGNKSTTIVAKRFHGKKGQGEEHFLMELEILFEYKHENIIGLEGYCNENGEKIIVYEHASNKSLDRRLSNLSLTWTKRLEISINIARGLAFLHRGAQTNETVIHRDIKSANILLKGDWKAKISDFGLSAIIGRNGKLNSLVVGTPGYVDPQFEEAGFYTEKSDIYSLGVVLFEILYGQLLVPTEKYDKEATTKILEQIHGEGKLESIVFKDIEEQIAPKALSTFRAIVSQCIGKDRKKRPTAKKVLQQLEKSLEFQEDYEKWGPKLPEDYEEIFKSSTYSGTYINEMKKDLYHLLSKGILLQDYKLWFSLGSNGERNEKISATTFSYRNGSPHDNWCVVPESRFKKVAEMLDISNLMIEIETRTQFLSPYTNYGVYLVFKFCDSINVSRNPMYVDLKYRKGSETLHAYFAKWSDDDWMRIELYRFLNQNKDVFFNFLLESLSPYYCKEHDAIYVEGIEFRAIDDVGHEEPEKSKIIQQVLKPNSNLDQVQMSTQNEMISKGSIKYEYGEELLSLSEVDGKKYLMLSAKAAPYNFPNLRLYNLKPSPESSFKEVLELLPQQIFRINCTIKTQMLSRDTEYLCYLVFKLSENGQELHGPVEVRDLLQKNKVVEIVYFRSPSPWNIHDITQVPKQRTDGWMEVNVWRFNSNHELEKDHGVLVNLKLTSYEGSLSGLILCGLEFRPIDYRRMDKHNQYESAGLDESLKDERDLDQIMADRDGEKSGSESNAEGMGERKFEGEVVDDLFYAYMNLDNLDTLNLSRTDEKLGTDNHEELDSRDSGTKMTGDDSSDNEASSSVNESGIYRKSGIGLITNKREGVKWSAGGDIAPTTRHYRSVSTDSFKEIMNFGDKSPKLPASPRGQLGQLSPNNSIDSNSNTFSLEFENGEFTGAELKKIMANDKLAEIALTDPKRAKRIFAKRQFAAQSKERIMRYMKELERKVQTLQIEATLSARLTLLQRDSAGLTSQNNELKFRLQAMEQQAKLRDALNEALTAEVHGLKMFTAELSGDAAKFSQHSINP